jgi:hypothetical protein
MTPFSKVYDRFFELITDDMYVEWTEQDTKRDAQSILISSLSGFEFPRQSLSYELFDYDLEEFSDDSYFTNSLTQEEINIIAYLMLINWLQRQITSIDNTRQKYYGDSFKLTSQASHLKALVSLKEDLLKDSKRLQRLYKRRKIDENGNVSSNWSIFNTYQ